MTLAKVTRGAANKPREVKISVQHWKRRDHAAQGGGRFAMIAAMLFSADCASPLWWHDTERGLIYHGWSINIAGESTKDTAFMLLGVNEPPTMAGGQNAAARRPNRRHADSPQVETVAAK